MIAAIMRTRRHGCRNHVVTATPGSRPRPAPAPGQFEATRNIKAYAATMHGDTEPMRKMLDTPVTEGTGPTRYLA